jgi:LPXTG-motif cell wall-anchored protein
MTLAEALAAMQCISDPSSSPACNLFTPQQLALPLCPGEMPPPLPTCADADAQAGIAYCNQYGANGPNPALNGLCWLSSKYPVWYSALKALPPCAGTGPDLPPPKKADEAGNKTLVWGGILVALLLVGGGVYYYTSKKKK